MKEEKVKVKAKIFETHLIIVLIGVFCMGFAFAQISDVALDITGQLIGNVQSGVFISDITKLSSTGVSSQEIKYYRGTTLSTSKVLTSTTSASLTYRIYVYNNSSSNYYFSGVAYDSYGYDNANIIYELSGIEPYITTIGPKGTINFNITFKYKDGYTPSSAQTLNSLLNFGFNNEFITFKADGKNYTAPKGATWEQFINSQYNTYGFNITNEKVCASGGEILLYNNKAVNKTDVITENASYDYETIELTLSRQSGYSLTQGDSANYKLNVTTNGTIKTTNIQAKLLNSSNSVVGNASVYGSGTSYTISVDTSSLPAGTYRIKVLEGAFTTTNRYSIR